MKHIVIIGGGVAGLRCGVELSRIGIAATILEREKNIGGKVRGWHKLFPSFTPARRAAWLQKSKCGMVKSILMILWKS